ncbi:unnamed protein product [Brassica napus]|uniref:(rape) hypothetical protein n=1 Tax=Brassica napus TaxID=3708 RepID=A0A816Z845_BRANA|nr:unnamed protein product [Brassica napus]
MKESRPYTSKTSKGRESNERRNLLPRMFLLIGGSTQLGTLARRSDPVNFPAKTNNSSRRSLSSSSFSSFSSCSSSSLVFQGGSPLNSPASPLRLLGVPFSWEQLPGKPKDYSHRLNHRQNNDSSVILPLPPHRSTHFPVTVKNKKSNSLSKKNSFPVTEKDPFAAALLECSKDDDEDEEDGEDHEVDRRFRGNSGGSSKALTKSSIGDRWAVLTPFICHISMNDLCNSWAAKADAKQMLDKRGPVY